MLRKVHNLLPEYLPALNCPSGSIFREHIFKRNVIAWQFGKNCKAKCRRKNSIQSIYAMKAIKRQTLEALTRIPICRSQIIVCCFQVLPPVGIAACVRTELCQQMLQYNFPHPTFTLNHCTQSQRWSWTLPSSNCWIIYILIDTVWTFGAMRDTNRF